MARGGAVETQSGTGKSQTSKQVIHKVSVAAGVHGGAHCFGGSCGSGQTCGNVVTDMEVVSVEPITSDLGTKGFEATETQDGGCACTDW